MRLLCNLQARFGSGMRYRQVDDAVAGDWAYGAFEKLLAGARARADCPDSARDRDAACRRPGGML